MAFMALLTPIRDGLRLFYERVTFSRLTTTYFAFSMAHFVIQLVLQIMAFQTNANAASFLQQIIVEGNGTVEGFTTLHTDLRLCTSVPQRALDTSSCQVIWNGIPKYSSTPANASSLAWSGNSGNVDNSEESAPVSFILSSEIVIPPSPSSFSPSSASSTSPTSATVETTHTVTVTVLETLTPSQVDKANENSVKRHVRRTDVERVEVNGQLGVRIDGLDDQSDLILDHTCVVTLNWPETMVDNTKREDIVFIMFQFWLLGMSFVALLNESIPHIIASLLTHVLVTAWAAFQIVNTNDFHNDFERLVTKGVCGVNLLPKYWSQRADAEIPSLALNVVALLVSVFLSWKLLKSFGWQTFKRVGASRTISRVYDVVLLLSIVIQLSLFFIIISASLWLDQVLHGNIGHLTSRRTAFEATMVVVIVLTVPWLVVGWTSARREHRSLMLVFLALSFLYLVGWTAMFLAATFRWTFLYWRFFTVITSASVFLTIMTLAMGVWCRMNFGKGLKRHLQGQERLPDDGAFSSEDDDKADFEKVEFPSTEWPLPTYTDVRSGPQLQAPDEAHFASRRMGPRFFNQSLKPFDTSLGDPNNYGPSSENGRLSPDVARSESRSSQRSGSSSSGKSDSGLWNQKRWVIE